MPQSSHCRQQKCEGVSANSKQRVRGRDRAARFSAASLSLLSTSMSMCPLVPSLLPTCSTHSPIPPHRLSNPEYWRTHTHQKGYPNSWRQWTGNQFHHRGTMASRCACVCQSFVCLFACQSCCLCAPCVSVSVSVCVWVHSCL